VDLFTETALDDIIIQTGAKVHSKGYNMVATERSHLFQFPTSHYSVEPGVFRVVVHIPIMKADSELRVFSYLPLPIPISEKTLVTFAPEQDVIAVEEKEDEFYRTMSTADLAKCHKVGDHYNCPNANTRLVANKETLINFAPEARCTYHMWRRQISMAEDHCTKRLSNLFNNVIQVGADRFACYTTETRQVTVYCEGRRPVKAEVTAPRTDFELADGCIAKIGEVMMATADLVLEGTGVVQPIQWNSAPDKILQGLNITWYENQRSAGRVMPNTVKAATDLMNKETALTALDKGQEMVGKTAAAALLWSHLEILPIAGAFITIALTVFKTQVQHRATDAKIANIMRKNKAIENGQGETSMREARPAQASQCFSESEVSQRNSLRNQRARSSNSTYTTGETRSGPLLPPRRRAPASEHIYASAEGAPEAKHECTVFRKTAEDLVFSA
jgi:hypothetical protein